MTGAEYNDTFSRGKSLRCALALAKRRHLRGYDAVKLAAAYDIPGHGEHGLLGGVANTAI